MHRRSLLLAAAALVPISLGLKPVAVQAAPVKPVLREVETETQDHRTLPVKARAIREAGDAKRADMIDHIAGSSELLAVMPFMDVPGGAYTYIQEGQLPGVTFFGDHPPARGAGVINPRAEYLKIVGGDLDVDQALLKTHGERIRPMQEKMKAKALGLYLTDMFINGDPTRDPRESWGLKHRFVGDQSVSLHGGRLRATQLDEVIDSVDYPTHIVCSKYTRNRLATSRALAGRITWELVEQPDGTKVRSAFLRISDDRVTRKLRIVCVDYNDRNEQIIPHADGLGSLYVLNLSDTGVLGLQNNVPEVDDLGLIDPNHAQGVEPSIWRTRVEWLASPAVLSGRSGAVIRDFQADKAVLT